jgi:hypothetical protein
MSDTAARPGSVRNIAAAARTMVSPDCIRKTRP